MKYDFLILGASGMQGKIASRDLLENGYAVFLADLYKEGSNKVLRKFSQSSAFEYIDLRDVPSTVNLIKKVEPTVVVNCAEGDWDLNVYKACLETKTHVIDLGSDIPMTKEQLALSSEFETNNLTAITGCGSTPGINNVMLQSVVDRFDKINTVEVGFAWDSNIKKFVVPFSIESIIEEFIEPVPIIQNGRWIDKMPLETIIEKEFREIGKQQCFLVRHPETYTLHLYYKRNGLKNLKFYAGFPQHSFDIISNFIELGLGCKEKIMVDRKMVAPLNVLTQTLKKIEYPEGYIEKENLWVDILGEKDGKEEKILMECIVKTLPGWEDAGCNIDTGIPASIIAQMIKDGRIAKKGSFAPEAVVPGDELFKELKKKEMIIYMNGKVIN